MNEYLTCDSIEMKIFTPIWHMFLGWKTYALNDYWIEDAFTRKKKDILLKIIS
jgi:hypothetical protein